MAVRPESATTPVEDETIAVESRDVPVSEDTFSFPLGDAPDEETADAHQDPTFPEPPPGGCPPEPDLEAMPLRERRALARQSERLLRQGELMTMSQAALLDYTEGLWWAKDDPDWDDEQRAYARLARRDELKLAQDEVHRRQRLVAGGRAVPTNFREQGARLTRLCRAIHEQVHLAHALEDAGMALVRRGREFHSECPACGGTDRFVIWGPPRSRGWCRQCGWSPDVIAFWRWHEGCGFADAVLAVADRYLGIGMEGDR